VFPSAERHTQLHSSTAARTLGGTVQQWKRSAAHNLKQNRDFSKAVTTVY
jgi:hypothetical protein